jgi:2'-5' RNA ligase
MRLDYTAQSMEFDAVWERRNQPPYVMGSWIDNDWAKGRTQYLTFLVRVQDSGIMEKVASIQRELSRFSCIDPLPLDYLHLTVKEMNSFLADDKKHMDEYTREELDGISSKAAEVIKAHDAFDVRLERLNNFTSVVCVEGHDGGIIRAINTELREKTGLPALQHDSAFLPHMSIAQYKNNEDYAELISYLEKNRNTVIGSIHINSIQLVIAHLPKTSGYSRLEVLEEYSLKH